MTIRQWEERICGIVTAWYRAVNSPRGLRVERLINDVWLVLDPVEALPALRALLAELSVEDGASAPR